MLGYIRRPVINGYTTRDLILEVERLRTQNRELSEEVQQLRIETVEAHDTVKLLQGKLETANDGLHYGERVCAQLVHERDAWRTRAQEAASAQPSLSTIAQLNALDDLSKIRTMVKPASTQSTADAVSQLISDYNALKRRVQAIKDLSNLEET